MRLMSFCTSPTVAANNAVVAPKNITTACAFGASSNSGDSRATMKTPAVTMVAAWINAETGVGPSMASGNQVCSRNWADLPIAPMNNKRQVSGGASAEEIDGLAGQSRCGGEDGFKIGRPDQHEDGKDAERKAEIADPVDDEGLDRRGVRRRLQVPES